MVTGRLGELRFKSSTGVTGQQVEERYYATLPAGYPRLFVQRNDTAMIANETRLWQPLGDRTGWVLGCPRHRAGLSESPEGESVRPTVRSNRSASDSAM